MKNKANGTKYRKFLSSGPPTRSPLCLFVWNKCDTADSELIAPVKQ